MFSGRTGTGSWDPALFRLYRIKTVLQNFASRVSGIFCLRLSGIFLNHWLYNLLCRGEKDLAAYVPINRRTDGQTDGQMDGGA